MKKTNNKKTNTIKSKETIVITKKDLNQLLLNTNQRLDLLRNAIFNLSVTLKFSTSEKTNITNKEYETFLKCIGKMEEIFSNFVKEIEMKWGEGNEWKNGKSKNL